MILQSPRGGSTNVEAAFFEPANTGTLVGFDENDFLYILGDGGDEGSLGVEVLPLYRWYVCLVRNSYEYVVLSWVGGTGEPDDESCVKVDVKRGFV